VGGKTKTKSTSAPPSWALPSIKGGLAALNSGLANANAVYGQYRPDMDAAIHQITQNIASPPQYVQDARGELDKTIKGDYVNANPYAEGMAKLIADKTQGGYGATFGASGRSHGGLAALLSGQGTADALGGFYGNLYEGERGRQERAILSAPAFHDDEYTDLKTLFPAVNNTAMGPLQAAGLFGQGVSGLTGSYGTTKTTQKQGVGLAQIIGLGLQAASMAAGMPMGFGG
jgi:hypothetical protein